MAIGIDVRKDACGAGDGFPQQLRQLREQRGISCRVLSELCGLSKNMIARYERGERVPSLEDAAALADFFDVTMDALWGRTEK